MQPPIGLAPQGTMINSVTVPVPSMAGVHLLPCSQPLPAKLVEKVASGDFVEMKELLGDNISLLHELDHVNGTSIVNLTSSMARPRLKEISSMASWLYCFLAYVALRCTDSETKHCLVYARLIIREAQTHGGQGWLMYNRIFRQQAELDRAL